MADHPRLLSRNVSSAEERFQKLAERWRRETALTASPCEMAMHPAYQQIIGMGREAIPLILKDLKQQPDHWFWALAHITGEDPVPAEKRGRLEAMTKTWLDWGRRNGYIR